MLAGRKPVRRADYMDGFSHLSICAALAQNAPVFVHPAAYTRTVDEVSGEGLAWPQVSAPEARFQGAIVPRVQ